MSIEPSARQPSKDADWLDTKSVSQRGMFNRCYCPTWDGDPTSYRRRW